MYKFKLTKKPIRKREGKFMGDHPDVKMDWKKCPYGVTRFSQRKLLFGWWLVIRDSRPYEYCMDGKKWVAK